MSFPWENEVGERLSVEELVAVYEKAEADIRASFGTIDAALKRLNQTTAGDYGFHLKNRYGRVETNWDEPDDVLKELRRQVWSKLLERMQVRKAMSIQAWEDLNKQVDREDPPAITIENVEGLIEQMRDDIPSMLEAAVKEVFEYLRPRNSRFKTNTEFEIGERVVLSYFVESSWQGWRVDYQREQWLIALENVFALLDGRVRQDTGYYSDLSQAIKACKGECHGGTELFEFRGYKNRNLHLRFKRMDLVKKLNAVAGGARLKPVPEEEEAA